MCGITGYFSYSTSQSANNYYSSHKTIAHRGPDDEGFIAKSSDGTIDFFCGDDTIDEMKHRPHINDIEQSTLFLGHRRLSIIDLTSHGHQPFYYDGLYLVYNGEIYNYIELRSELESLGYHFETKSDTEVFLKAFHCWQENAFNKFNGMWAAAIYSKENDDIILTRDRYGIKPLYYSIVNGSLLFGSEIKFILPFHEMVQVDAEMVYEYLEANKIDHTEKTLFRNIFQLEPNQIMRFSRDGVKVKEYWQLSQRVANLSTVEEKLTRAINIRMRSDVEVGSLLSGGIDSSTILGIINKKKLARSFNSFSAVFHEEKFSEKRYIEEFEATNLELHKNYIYPEVSTLIDRIEDLLRTQELPFRSLSTFSQYEIYRYIKGKTHTTVLLNGQGADEIFTGYTEFYYVYLLELLRKMKFATLVRETLSFAKNRNLTTFTILTQLMVRLKRLALPHKGSTNRYGIFLKEYTAFTPKQKFKDRLTQSLWYNLTFSALREYLRYEDRNSMRFSLESRLPFLDYKLVEVAFSLDNSDKIKDGVSKKILRDIAADLIPQKTLNRKDKMGFVSPQEEWQKTLMKDELDKEFKDIQENGLFSFLDSRAIHKQYASYINGEHNDWPFIWRVYCLSKWKKVWEVVE